jgi:UDPglucose 6-dehydrogenase
MRICVLGLWHLGSVTAAALAELGHEVVGLDFDPGTVSGLRAGAAPVFEPGLEVLLRRGLTSGRLRFAASLGEVPPDIEILWVAYDTPVDAADGADADFVLVQVERALVGMNADTLLLVSSQLPVGSIRRLERATAVNGSARLRAACCPENLRLGRAVDDFLHPQRIVAGVRSERDRELLQRLLSPLSTSIEWMSVESAEMTKHAINAFLATSVAFANEIATLCESTGADATEVARGLKSEGRIGPRAYVSPGAAFSGGTLARDVTFLNRTAAERGIDTPLLSAVLPSNRLHGLWAQKTLQKVFGELTGRTVAVWGLAYKPGTDTLRRSLAVELCDWLLGQGALVRVHDPMVTDLPRHWSGVITKCEDPADAVQGADALVVATEWPQYQNVPADVLTQRSGSLVVLDASRFLPGFATLPDSFRYLTVGMPGRGD